MKSIRKSLTIGVISCIVCSCSSEKGKIEALLVEYLGTDNQKVEIVEYQIKDIITCNNIKDSISMCEYKVMDIERMFIDKYKAEIEKNQQIINRNLASKAEAPSFLKHDWDNINRTYYDFIEDYEKKILNRQAEIDAITTKKKSWEDIIAGKEELEKIFTKYKVTYSINGKISNCELNVAPGFKLFTLGNNEKD